MRKLFCTASISLKSIYLSIFESVSNSWDVLAYDCRNGLDFSWAQVGRTVEFTRQEKEDNEWLIREERILKEMCNF
jgi:hypothetical protein